MKHRLAFLALEPEHQEISRQISQRFADKMSGAWERDTLRRIEAAYAAAIEACMRAPDLLDSLAADDLDRPWLTALVETFAMLQASGRRPRLVQCERVPGQDGFVAVAVEDPSLTATVLQDDVVSGGCALLRSGDRAPVAWPRIYRKVCINGTIVHVGDGCEHAVTPESLPDVVVQCLSAPVLAEAVGRFRTAAAIPVIEPESILARAGIVASEREVASEWRRAGDSSAWGLVNAATALAREEPDLSRRFAREEDAERILRAVGVGSCRRGPQGRHGTAYALMSA